MIFIRKHLCDKNNLKWFLIGIMLLLSAFFLSVKLVPDSNSFIYARRSRAVLYPCFLHLFQFIFGEDLYLRMVVIAQNLLFVFAAAAFIEFICRRFARTAGTRIILYFFCSCIYIIPSLMSKTGMLNIIWSEGVSISLYLLFSKYLFEYILERNNKSLLMTYLYAIICALVRKQMLLLIPCVLLISIIINRHAKRKILYSLLLTVLGGGIFIISGILYDSFICSNKDNIDAYDCNRLANIVYFSQEEDIADLDDDCQILFRFIYEEMEKENALYYKVKDRLSWYGIGKHKAEYYDVITYDMILERVLPEYYIYYGEKYHLNERAQMEQPVRQNLKTLEKVLIKKHLREFAFVYFIWTVTGFLETIVPAAQAYTILFPEYIHFFQISLPISAIFVLIASALYIVYILFTIMTIKRRRECGNIGITILLLITANAAATSLFIMPLHRYLLYNSMLFYMFFFIMFKDLTSKYSNIDSRLLDEK